MNVFKGRVAVVTGAGSGIGLGLARTFARERMAVALLDYRGDTLDAAAQQVRDLGGEPLPLAIDVGDRAALDRAADRIEAAFGNIHILCNNAGVLVYGKQITETTFGEWDWIVRTNLFGAINGVEIFLPRMQRHGEPGHVVNTSSIGGFQIRPGLGTGAYSVTKYGVLALSETLALDLAGTPIGVSVLAPAAANTGIYNSDSLRPDRPGNSGATIDRTPDSLKAGMSGDLIGRRVLAAIRDGDFFVFTHVHTRAWLEERHQRIMAGFDAAERWKETEPELQ